jgi:hypothetical protein
MTASFSYVFSPVSELTQAQLAELKNELQQELFRLELRLTGGTRPLDVRTQDRIHLIMDALKRIQSGTYGACLLCRSPIPYQRLTVLPETKTCVDCGLGPVRQHGV